MNQDHASDHEQLAQVCVVAASAFVEGVGALGHLGGFVAGKLPWPKLFTGTLATRGTGHSSRSEQEGTLNSSHDRHLTMVSRNGSPDSFHARYAVFLLSCKIKVCPSQRCHTAFCRGSDSGAARKFSDLSRFLTFEIKLS